MSLSARLHIQGHSKENQGIKILSSSFSFSQDVDARGMTSSKVRAGMINLTLHGGEDPEIIQWMLGGNIRKNGKIVYTGVTDTGPKRSVEFEDALLVDYKEDFNDQTDIIIRLVISARMIVISGVVHESMWTSGNT